MGADLPGLTPTDWQNIAAHDFDPVDRAEAVMRALKRIALNPGARAEALLSLDVHIAYLRAQFHTDAPESQP